MADPTPCKQATDACKLEGPAKGSHMKKARPPEIRAGIWLDQENAVLVILHGKEEPQVSVVLSGVESRVRIKGEGKVYSRFGSAFISDQEKKQRRQQNQRKHFFREIMDRVQEADYLFVFGPGPAKEGLRNVIEKTRGFKPRLAALEVADEMPEDAVAVKVQKYFLGMAFKAFKRQLRLNRQLTGFR